VPFFSAIDGKATEPGNAALCFSAIDIDGKDTEAGNAALFFSPIDAKDIEPANPRGESSERDIVGRSE
jgi:hypothetical protein